MPSGCSLITESLTQLGIDTVFGIPGTQSIALFDALRRSSHLRTLTASDERFAAFMANGFYRASGRPAALVTIPGPGVTHATSGIAEARMDSVALLHLVVSGNDPGSARTRLQPTFADALTPSLYRAAYSASRPDEIGEALSRAFVAMMDGEPGPVLVEIEVDAVHGESRSPRIELPAREPDDLGAVVEVVRAADRVSVLAGMGCLDAHQPFREVVNRHGFAVATTCSGLGVLPDAHPANVCPDFGLHGHEVVNALFAASDLVLILGCKLSHNGTAGFALRFPEGRTIRVDRSSSVDEPYPIPTHVGDCDALLRRLLELPPAAPGFDRETLRGFRERFEASRSRYRRASGRFLRDGGAKALALLDALAAELPADATVVTDSGRHQLLVRGHFPVRSPRGLIAPTDFQSMGFALPAGLGAAQAYPDRPTVVILGDGGFAMSGFALLSARRLDSPFIVVVFNDRAWGQIRDAQRREFGVPFATDTPPLDLAALSRGFGVHFQRVGDPTVAVRDALTRGGVTVLELALAESPVETVRTQGRVWAANEVKRWLGADRVHWLKQRLRR